MLNTLVKKSILYLEVSTGYEPSGGYPDFPLAAEHEYLLGWPSAKKVLFFSFIRSSKTYSASQFPLSA
jgi:hypothetical protein